ncbi:MAG: DNA gyrase/topoisomerase IV subunit A [Bacteroidetes bacterium]|jgi:topoisomerase IV subunit A|nr:DNA gyrase/topoisomerase IV subunit A [Bacteroidota bacterium]MBT5529616.1 DNA gyrase/topoisomerase IV subunit A [Cytophagia bacterium]MBT3421321.1 DNA gyrase/topoisomerase IV subunit A [Bacteroidota bacterium]MBT3933277.1 DNA gyrase/topoisomerase IV subunit A [Bacteroidota bacterium]MBT4338772.1 DNA gyrase/topoisomerase IV subunit A [Bacteroidota bacterium]
MDPENDIQENQEEAKPKGKDVKPVSSLYKEWFLDYASYVILERAVPAIDDGLKPVHRRILHAMKETDDGRFNKVANVIGNTMQYHPHGDQSISDAIVNIGQKDLLIDTQGNWGDVVTGDSAAAARYIETRLSKFAHEVVFNPETTEWQSSYDGRKREPINLPVKFPLVLSLGAEGIAVGLSTRILPHNFNELIRASIAILKGNEYEIYPDFPTNGLADFSNYNQGKRGGKVRVRSKIEIIDKKTVAIRNVPFSVTTTTLIDSIVKANDKGKIKIKQVIDNTAKDVEIIVELQKGISPDVTIDALYAFTSCETSISTNACVIQNDKPVFIGVRDILEDSTQRTIDLLKRELEILRDHLLNKWHYSSLEKIFIEKKVYRDIEECETWEAVIEAIDEGLKPHIKHLKRAVTTEDIVRLTDIKIKRISKYDAFKADEIIIQIEKDLEEVEFNLSHLIDFAIKYFENLLKKYGKGRERKTEIRHFDTIQAKNVVAANKKLYVNRADGFFGFGLKKEESIGECSELDDVITFRKDGTYSIQKVDEKVFAGKNIIHIDVFKKDDERMTYNAVYLDGKSKNSMVKRFNVTSITRDKEYDLTKKSPGSKIIYFTANPLGETDTVTVYLTQGSKARKKIFDFNFATIDIKGRASQGNILTKYPVRRIVQKSVDKTNIIGIDVWYDEYIGKLNTKEIGRHIGSFAPDDLILAITSDGYYELKAFDVNNHYDIDKITYIEKFNPNRALTAIYLNGESNIYYAKRFKIETSRTNTAFKFISENKKSKLIVISDADRVIVKTSYLDKKSGDKNSETLELSEFIELMGWKAVGKKLNNNKVTSVKIIDMIYEEVESEIEEEVSTVNVEIIDEVIDEEPAKKTKPIDDIEEDVPSSISNPTEGEIKVSDKKEEKDESSKPEKETPKITKKPFPKTKEKIVEKKPKKSKDDDDDSGQLSLF